MNRGGLNMLRPILLIEDNQVDAELTQRAFKRRKMANPVEVVPDGARALDWLEKWGRGSTLPQVVVLDWRLPGQVNGLEVLRRFKAHPQLNRLPVVIFSACSQGEEIRSAYQNGASSYIIKPVDYTAYLDAAGQIDRYWGAVNEAA